MFEDNDFVCKHMMLRKKELVRLIREKGLKTMDEIQDETNAATICGSCYADLEEILEEELNKEKKEE